MPTIPDWPAPHHDPPPIGVMARAVDTLLLQAAELYLSTAARTPGCLPGLQQGISEILGTLFDQTRATHPGIEGRLRSDECRTVLTTAEFFIEDAIAEEAAEFADAGPHALAWFDAQPMATRARIMQTLREHLG